MSKAATLSTLETKQPVEGDFKGSADIKEVLPGFHGVRSALEDAIGSISSNGSSLKQHNAIRNEDDTPWLLECTWTWKVEKKYGQRNMPKGQYLGMNC